MTVKYPASIITAIIPAKHWRRDDGLTASIYGACPWYSMAEKKRWTLVEHGYTWRRADGTVGLGRKPVKTKAEALAIANRINDYHGAPRLT